MSNNDNLALISIELENQGYYWSFDGESNLWTIYDSLNEDGYRLTGENKIVLLLDLAGKLAQSRTHDYSKPRNAMFETVKNN